MKKLFYAAVALLTTIAISTSCGVQEEGPDTYTAMATVVEGTAAVPYYIVFDDGKEAYVTNFNEWYPSFSETNHELRYIIAYQITSETSNLFDMEIKLIDVNHIATQNGGLKEVTATDFTGDYGLQNYKSGASVAACFLTPARDYITLMISFYGRYGIAVNPKMKLVSNTDRENSPYKELYKDDNYIYLELYHDNSAYAGEQELNTYWSCKMPDIDNIINQYSGVKILAIDHNTLRPKEFTFNFTTEEQPKVE